MPDRKFYCDEVLKSLPQSGDDWDAVQQFEFATCMAFSGDERAKQILYESFDPGPSMGEAIAVNLVRLDSIKGFLFAASKIGALLISRPDEVDEGWLWSQAIELCGENAATGALSEAAATDPRIDVYRATALSLGANRPRKTGTWEEIAPLGYDELASKLAGLRAFRLRRWGKEASAEELARAANGLLAAHAPEGQTRHLRIFSERAFPLDPAPLLELAFSNNEDLALAAAVALSQIEHPSIRAFAFRLVQSGTIGRQAAIAMLDRNWEPIDNEVALSWFESELDRQTRHRMGLDLTTIWEHHPEPESELQMLQSLYKKGPCSFCREFVVKRLIELDALSASMRAECTYDANEYVRALVVGN